MSKQIKDPTELPLKIEPMPDSSGYLVISGPGGKHVTDFVKPGDAALIVSAVNHHADLVNALDYCVSVLQGIPPHTKESVLPFANEVLKSVRESERNRT